MTSLVTSIHTNNVNTSFNSSKKSRCKLKGLSSVSREIMSMPFLSERFIRLLLQRSFLKSVMTH